jgi:ATP-dependent Zn protease
MERDADSMGDTAAPRPGDRKMAEHRRPAGAVEKPARFHFGVGYVLVVIAALFAINDILLSRRHVQTIPYSEFLEHIDEGRVENVTMSDSRVSGELRVPTKGERRVH